MTEISHDYDTRDFTNSLLDLSELATYESENNFRRCASQNDLKEVLSGWKRPGEISKLSKNSNLKKKRGVERSVTELHYGSTYPSQQAQEDYWSNSLVPNEQRAVVRRIGDEFETYPIPPWKSNIEQGTCRYIHDNGSYRTLKFMYDDRKDWYTIRKKRPEKVSTTWHHTCKRMQREMKRQLKKDIAVAERERARNSKSKSDQNSARSGTEATSGEDTARSVSRLSSEEAKNDRIGPQKLDISFSRETLVAEQKVTDMENSIQNTECHGRSILKKETRVKSTHSDGALNQVSKMKTINESEPVTPMPQYSIPSGSHMLKSVSDLFIENFSSRISALEDEIKKDSKWLRKNENELTKLQSNRAKYRDVTRPANKDGSSSVTPRGSLRTEALTSDIFSVKPMASKEAKPLDKIKSNNNKTSTQPNDIMQNEACNKNSSSTYTNTMNGINSDIEKGLTGYKTLVDNSKQTLFDTLTGKKINTHGNKKSSKGFSTPSTITLCDNSPNSGQEFSEHRVDAFRQIIVDKKAERKGTLQNIPAFLPEISGKRLEPTSISHRLL